MSNGINYDLIFLVQLVLCSFMCGVIWLVQLVHYPIFLEIKTESFAKSMLRHQRQITWLVAPTMTLELFSAIALVIVEHDDRRGLGILNLILLSAIWLSTFLVSVPRHTKLLAGYDRSSINSLVLTNWPRTALWTFRLGLLVYWRTSLR